MSLLRSLIPLLLVMFSLQTAARDQTKIDSLRSLIKGDMDDSTRVRLQIDLAMELGSSDTLQAFASLEKAREILEYLDDTRGWGRYHHVLGKIQARCGLYDDAFLHFDRALVYFNEADDQLSFYETIKEKGNLHLFRSEYPQAMNHYESALDFYRRSNNVIGISRCLNNMGIIHKNRGEYVEAMSVYQESIVYLDSVRNAMDISQAYINMGNLFVYLGSYERALDFFSRALDIAERNDFQNIISLCLLNSGVIQNKVGNYDEALNLYRRALQVSRKLNDPVLVSNCLINIGTNYADMNEPEMGLDYVQKGLAIKTELGDERTISNCYIHLADLYSQMEEHEKAMELFNRALPIKEQLNDPDGLIRSYLGLGSVAFKLKRYSTAERMAEMGLEIALEIRAMEYIARSYQLKKEIAVNRGDYRSAYQYEMQHHLYGDSLMDEATAKAALEMELRMRSKVLQQENENLKIQSNLDQLLVKRRTTIYYFILALASILLLALILVIYYMRRHKKSSLKLEEKNLVITKQNLKLDQVNKTKDKMMSIIAHDLRGTIGNQLTAVEVLNRIEGDKQVKIDRGSLLGNLKNSAAYSLELLENLLHWSRLEEGASKYHPEEVKLNMLVSNCLSLYSENAKNKDLTVEKDIRETVVCYMDKIMMETVFRNLISNAIKFSKPGGTIHIGLDRKDGMIQFRVKDQGVGMSQEDAEKILQNGGISRRGTANEKGAGMGLTLVQEFTKIHNGELFITCEPDKGCTFEVAIPCIN
jgi:signal transduction histidine kinase/Tfp pilus assembly protein PilF